MRFFFILISFFYLMTEAGTFKENQIDPIISRATDWTSLKIFLAGATSVALTRSYDDELRSNWKNHQKMTILGGPFFGPFFNKILVFIIYLIFEGPAQRRGQL